MGSNFYIYYLTCFATIGGVLFGYDTAVISGAMLLIDEAYHLTTMWKQLIVSATVGAAAIFALVGGYLADLMGRKKVIMLASVCYTVGAVVMGASNGKEMLFVGRTIVGAAIGLASMSIPVYVAESSPANIRGSLVTINQLCITIGIVISSVVAGLFSTNSKYGWRYMLGLAGFPGIIQFIGFIGLPESPRWLMEKGRVEDARKSLQKIRKIENVSDELQEIGTAIKETKRQLDTVGMNVLFRMLKTQPVRRALFLGCGMQLFQQLCGINTVIYYSGSILKLAGFPVELAIWLVCVPNTVNCLCTFIGIWLVDRCGRRWLTIFSIIGVMIGLAVLAIGFQLSTINSPKITVFETSYGNNSLNGLTNGTNKCFSYVMCEDCITKDTCGFCYEKHSPESSGSCLPAVRTNPERYAYLEYSSNLAPNISQATFRCNKTSTWDLSRADRTYMWAYAYCPTKYAWMAVLGLALFVMGFAPGLGPMPWTINSEIYPTWARSMGNSLATATMWIFNLIVSLTFLSLLESLGKYGTYWLYFGICFLGVLFNYFLLPETKNKTLEQVQELFKSKEYKKQMTRDITKQNPNQV